MHTHNYIAIARTYMHTSGPSGPQHVTHIHISISALPRRDRYTYGQRPSAAAYMYIPIYVSASVLGARRAANMHICARAIVI